MKIDIIKTEDLQQFKMDLMQEIKGVLHHKNLSKNKEWLRSCEVKVPLIKGTGKTIRKPILARTVYDL